MSKFRGKEIVVSPVHSKAQQAFDYICRAKRATGSEIAAAVPGLAAKNVIGTLQSRINNKDVLVETGLGASGRIERIYKPAEKHLRESAPVGTVTQVPVAQTHAMTSVLRTGTKFGPGAAGGPIRDTGPARDKGSPITLAYVPTPNPEGLVALPRLVKPAAPATLAADLKAAVAAAERQQAEAAPAKVEARQMQQDQREQMERDLKAGIETPTTFWLSDDGAMIIEDPAQSICLEPADTARLYRLLAGCVVLTAEVSHAV